MSVKAMAAVVAAGEGGSLNVSQTCRAAGVSRKTFYKWVARYREGGLEALEDQSRRPLRSPGQTPLEVEERVVLLRKELGDAGLDQGATTIQWHLGRDPEVDQVPSVASIHRILVRRGLVVPEPKKRPKSSWRRFEASTPNEWWQIDAMDWVIATGVVRVFNIIDDHSRVAVVSRAVAEASTAEAWQTFTQGAEQWGLPAGVLSDNGLCFSGKLRNMEVAFEANLRDLGVRPFTGRPYHPQTTGKVERFQQTLKKWLARQPLAAGLVELQHQLDTFNAYYNERRPHQGIGGVTPMSRWQASVASRPADEPLPHPDFTHTKTDVVVTEAGTVRPRDSLKIHIGAEWAGQPATVIIQGLRATVLVNGQLVRHLEIDPNRFYQRSGRRRGGPRKPRLGS